jgi:hypothetical protein
MGKKRINGMEEKRIVEIIENGLETSYHYTVPCYYKVAEKEGYADCVCAYNVNKNNDTIAIALGNIYIELNSEAILGLMKASIRGNGKVAS